MKIEFKVIIFIIFRYFISHGQRHVGKLVHIIIINKLY